MAQKITREMLEARAQEIREMTVRMSALNDGERIVKASEEIKRKAEELQAMGIVFEQQQTEGVPKTKPVGIVRVQLTESQRKAVHEATGVWLDVVPFREGIDLLPEVMPGEQPELVQSRAIEYAWRQRKAAEGDAVSRVAMMDAFKELEAQNNPDLNAMLEAAKKDPNYLGAYLEAPPKKK